MPMYLLCHRHEPAECRSAYAAWKGFDSPLRHHRALASCTYNGHEIWWTVEADNADDALNLVPSFIAHRTTAVAVTDVQIP
jgi:hypothetical protein